MGKPRQTFNKRDIQNKKSKKRKEKEQKRSERSEKNGSSSPDDMIAYVDEFGNITSTPPDPSTRMAIKPEDINISVPKSEAADPADLIRTGIVTFFDETKGFGFIRDSDSQQEIFVHINGLLESIKADNQVTFEVVKGPKGFNAVNVKIKRE